MRSSDDTPRPATLKWLLDADPAIRWQVMRDLTDTPPADIAAERSRVATEGWGAHLLAQQLPNAAGHKANGISSPSGVSSSSRTSASTPPALRLAG